MWSALVLADFWGRQREAAWVGPGRLKDSRTLGKRCGRLPSVIISGDVSEEKRRAQHGPCPPWVTRGSRPEVLLGRPAEHRPCTQLALYNAHRPTERRPGRG